MQDSWKEMALERQFRPLVESSEYYPATLAYLQQVRDKGEVAPSATGALDYEIDQLTDALLAGEYAEALAMRVWDPDAEPEEYKNYMNETLENPEVEFVSRIVTQSEVYGGG